MDLKGEYRIAAPRRQVWEALNDPEVLRQCIPGCEEIEKVSDTEFRAKVMASVGPVKARFGGNVTLTDLDPPNGYTINGEGQGGAAGFAKGGARVDLEEDGADGTLLRYTVNASVGGKLAQIGSRLVQSTARKMADDFFGRFRTVVEGPAAPEAAAAAEAAPSAPEPFAPSVEAATTEHRDTAMAPDSARPEPQPAPRTPTEPGIKRSPALNPFLWVGGLILLIIVLLFLLA